MTLIHTKESNFQSFFYELLGRGRMDMEHVSSIVKGLIDDIRTQGDAALMQHIAKFDRWTPSEGSDLRIDPAEMKRAYEALNPTLKASLHLAYDRIKVYHEKQLPKSWVAKRPERI